jgi:hypothetical protein
MAGYRMKFTFYLNTSFPVYQLQPPTTKNIPLPLIEANRCFFFLVMKAPKTITIAFKQPHLVPRFMERVALLPLCGPSDGEVHLFWVLKMYTNRLFHLGLTLDTMENYRISWPIRRTFPPRKM